MTNNSNVRELLVGRGIKPERLSKEEDIKKLEKKIRKDEKSIGAGFYKK